MNEAYSNAYRELYERHWWWRAREAAIADVLAGLAPAGGFARALDVGCGDGLLFPVLERVAREVEGVEPYAPLSDEAGAGAARTIHRAPFDDRFAPGREFPLVVMLDVLEHLDDDVGALRVVRRLMGARGVLLLTVPAFPALWTRHDEINQHRRRYTAPMLRRATRAAGLTVRDLRFFFHWLAPVKLLTRGLESVLSRRPSEVPRVPAGPVNRALTMLSRVEWVATRRLHIPFGSSLLAVVTTRESERTVGASTP